MIKPDESSSRELVEGYEYPAINFALDAEDVATYLKATDDTDSTSAQSGPVPPLAVAARALAELSRGIISSPGTVHSSQELDFILPVAAGEPLELMARVEKKLDRDELHLLTTGFRILNQRLETVMTGRITVACRAAEARWLRTP